MSKSTPRKLPTGTIFPILVLALGGVSAFLPASSITRPQGRHQESSSTYYFRSATELNIKRQQSKSFTPLKMSTLDPEETRMRKIISKFTSKLPPPPEDQISMAGDVACLFLYSFIDHFVNRLYDSYLNSPDTINKFSASAAIESASAASSEISTNIVGSDVAAKSLPVWFDATSSAPFGNIPLTSALPLEHHITYSPAIATGGAASVLLCSAWLLSGYFTGAFQFKNALMASPNKALVVTAKTWVLSSLMMFGIAYGSDSLIGCADCLHNSVGITKADSDFIIDSLSVLLVWRFILSSFFGSND